MKDDRSGALVPTWVGSVLRPALNALPFGGVLATAWNEWDTNRRMKNIEDTVAELEKQLVARGQAFDPKAIGPAEMHFLDLAIEKVQREHREAKRRQFAALIADAWSSGFARPFEEKVTFLDALDEFDELHFEILKHISKEAEAGRFPSFAAIGDTLGIPPDKRDEVLIPAIDKLASGYGFVRRAWGMSSGEGGILFSRNLSPEGIARGCDHTITDAGRRFLQAIASNVSEH
jgi:hypothetical protein